MKLTVIVPVYNVEKYLDECISSLISQTEDFDEIILINDGSTDRSGEICEKYYRQYANIKFINQSNKGLSATRNTGIRKAAGEYILFVDSDDYVTKTACAGIKKALRLKETEVLYYNADIKYEIPVRESKNAYRHSRDLDGQYMTGMDYLEKAFPGQYTASACVAAYNKMFLLQNHIFFPEGIYFEDNYFSLQVMSKARTISGIRDAIYRRRFRENSIVSGSVTEKKCEDLVIGQKLMWQYLAGSLAWNGRKELLCRFIAFGILHTFFQLAEFPDKDFTDGLKSQYAGLFFSYWHELFREENQNLGPDLAFLLILKEASKVLQKRGTAGWLSCQYPTEKQLYDELGYIKSRVHKQIFEKLLLLPLQKGKKVGIYGTGNHTRTLLKMYQSEIGQIQSELFFIVSSSKANQNFLNRRVITYKEIPKDADYIVISSLIHQQEMYENLLEQNIKKENICLLYTEQSVCDLVMAAWAIKE